MLLHHPSPTILVSQHAASFTKDVSMSFPYRRWYAELSSGELSDFLDVGLTGAPDYVKAQFPSQKYVALLCLTSAAQKPSSF